MRGIAAFLVLIEHWRNAFFLDFPQIQQHRAIWGPLYVISGAGHQAVIIFFVLSGYLISGTVLRAIRRSQWSWPRYLIHRLVRLWLVLIPALILGFAWDTLGLHLNRAPMLYAGAGGNHLTAPVAPALTAATFFGNLAFLQTIVVPPLGSNGALWSLANEWWYYILFPLVACVIARVFRKPLIILAYMAGLVAIAVLIGKAILLLFPVWLLGTLLYLVPKPTGKIGGSTLGCAGILYAAAFFGFAVLAHRGGHLGVIHVSDVIADTFLGIVTFAFLWLLLSRSDKARHTRPVRLARETARFSYTLYVTHTPLLIFAASLLVRDSRWTPTVPHLLPALVVLAVAIAYAWLVASRTEFKTDIVRGSVENQILPDAKS